MYANTLSRSLAGICPEASFAKVSSKLCTLLSRQQAMGVKSFFIMYAGHTRSEASRTNAANAFLGRGFSEIMRIRDIPPKATVGSMSA